MPAVLIALPTARPACADDSERTQMFRPAQKRPTWKDVERERARSSAPAVPVLRLAPKPPDTRGSSTPAAKHVPPYLRPGYWKGEVKLGSELHAEMRREMGKDAAIRSCPPSLAKLLATPEWRGASIQQPSQTDLERMRALCAQAVKEACEDKGRARSSAQKRAADTLVARREDRLSRLPETVRIVHPSGASILWLAP